MEMDNRYLKWLGFILVLGVIHVISEFASKRIASKVKTSDPLYRRVIYLVLLLVFIILMIAISWLVLKLIGY